MNEVLNDPQWMMKYYSSSVGLGRNEGYGKRDERWVNVNEAASH